MIIRDRAESRFARVPANVLPWLLMLAAAALLAGCGGGSSSGGGTANSPFVGTYDGSTDVTVTTDVRAAASAPVTIFVHRDGLVQVADAQSTVFASGPLRGDSIHITSDAASLVATGCSGSITLAGTFTASGDEAAFEGRWFSDRAGCSGVAGQVAGSMSASRVESRARASRVFETSAGVLRRAFAQATE